MGPDIEIDDGVLDMLRAEAGSGCDIPRPNIPKRRWRCSFRRSTQTNCDTSPDGASGSPGMACGGGLTTRSRFSIGQG